MIPPHKTAAIVLAAGKSSPMGSDLHKVLHKLNGKALLGHVLDNLAAHEVERTIVVTGREQINAVFPNLDTVIQQQQLGTGANSQDELAALEAALMARLKQKSLNHA